jgi:hypothetical protein
MKVEIVGGNLVVTCPIEERPSSTGKTILIANSGGWQKTTVQHKDRQISVNLMASVKPS